MNDEELLRKLAFLGDAKKPQAPKTFEDQYLNLLERGALAATGAAIGTAIDIGRMEAYKAAFGDKSSANFSHLPVYHKKNFSLMSGLAIGATAFAGIVVILWALKK